MSSLSNIVSVVFILFIGFSYAQTKITVLDLETELELGDVKIFDSNYNKIGTTNLNGMFTVPQNVKIIYLKKDTYSDLEVNLTDTKQTIYLSQFQVSLNEISITSDDPKARKLIEKVIQNYKKNSPENLINFQYKTYSKFWTTTQKDSIPIIENPQNADDSASIRWRKLLDKSLLFIGERAMDHKYDAKYGWKNIVRANRVSGATTPLYELVAAQPISHQFDNENFRFFFRNYVNPISKLGLKTYRYQITDTINLNNTKSIEVAFIPRLKDERKSQIRGKVWIEKENFALIKFSSESTEKNSIAELEMDWVKFKNYWFPKEQRFLFESGNFSYTEEQDSIAPDGVIVIDTVRKKELIWTHLTNTFKDFQSPVAFSKKEFKGYENEIAKDAFDAWDEILKTYRNEQLTTIERNTYEVLDSVAKAEKFDRALRLFRILSKGGKYEVGKLDVDLTRIINYNDYEGFRVNIPLSTNYKLSENFAVNGYLGYGFKDEEFKYGGGLDWFVNKPYSGKLFVNYFNDVQASGRTDYVLRNNFVKFRDGSLNNIYNDQFYSFKKLNIGYQQDVFKNVTLNFSANIQEQRPEFNYSYQNFPIGETFNLNTANLAIRWAPKEKNIRTPFGKVSLETGLPVMYINIEQGVDLFDSDFNPTKFETRFFHRFDSFVGRTNMVLNAGYLTGDAPIMNLFEGQGNGRNGNSIGGRFAVAAKNTFETMRPGEFYSDRYFSFQLRHQVAGFEILKKQFYPEFIYRGLIGDMSNIQDHQNLLFNVPTGYFQEAGVELNGILFGAVGLGGYYRFGTYSLGGFNQNFTFKLTLNLPSF